MQEEQTEKQQGTLSDVRSHGEGALESTRHESRKLAGEAKEHLAAEATARKNTVAKELGNLSRALDLSAEEMEKHDSALTEPLRQIASFCTRSADSVSRKGPRELVSQVERFGREQPLLFFGAAIAAGFLTTRLLRSEPSKQEPERPEPIGESPDVSELEAQLSTTGAIQEQVPSPVVPTSESLNVPGPSSEGASSESNRPLGT